MCTKFTVVLTAILCFYLKEVNSICNSIATGVTNPKNNDGQFMILIQGNPKGYIPNQLYNITLQSNSSYQQHFKRFSLTVDPLEVTSDNPTGKFEIGSNYVGAVKFDQNCPNTVIETSSVPKEEIQVFWRAPEPKSGCFIIKAVVIVSDEVWYALDKTMCEDTDATSNIQPIKIEKCCACNEAKYELAFEGKWIKNTHPRNYPSDVWSTKFSDIIGASHKTGASFWMESGAPSEGLKELAKSGNISQLEAEIIEQNENIRTIIKAKGLQYPYITQSSYAVFRVDRENHRISVVSKMIPSPDWIVGVSEFELCTENNTWIDKYSYELYPFDVGIDDGIGYHDSKPVNDRFIRIRAITENNPNHPDSPFFSEKGEPLKPIAMLHFKRQRLYEKSCDEKCGEEDEEQPDEEEE